MFQEITLHGKASQKSFQLKVTEEDLEKDLLSFLRSRSFPVASSCSGAGQCQKCLFNGPLLSCQAKVKDFIGKQIEFDYL